MIVSSGDFRVYMRQLAGWVWNQQKHAFRYGLSLQEETITEMLLLRMARKLTPLGFRVRLFTRSEEGGRRRHGKVIRRGLGADWEWFYEAPGCRAGFRVQAKRLYRTPSHPEGYDNFDPGGKQINDLLSQAGSNNPIYVFFNHPDVHDDFLFNPSGPPDYFGRSCWGCSVATANFMKTVNDNKLATIHPGQVPWHRFFGIGTTCRSAEMMKSMPGYQRFILADEPPDWVNILLENPQYLDELLAERGLKGVAYFKYRKS